MDLLVARLLYFVKIPVKWGGEWRETFKNSSQDRRLLTENFTLSFPPELDS
jgi:hypothetical protein